MSLTWREALADAKGQLGQERAHEARWLVERASGHDGPEVLLHLDEPIADRHLAFFDKMLARRISGEPLQYVLGRWSFRSLELYVDRRVLIPRPETELVAGLAIDALAQIPADARLVADLGTGSGAIGLSVASEVPGAKVWLTDRSDDALAVARANLAGLGGRAAARVTTAAGSWFEALPISLRGAFAVIVSNPPYIAADADLPMEVVEWEPPGALFAGADGTDDLRHLITHAVPWLAPGGSLVVELSPEQAPAMASLANDAGFDDVRVVADLAGRARALVGRR